MTYFGVIVYEYNCVWESTGNRAEMVLTAMNRITKEHLYYAHVLPDF